MFICDFAKPFRGSFSYPALRYFGDIRIWLPVFDIIVFVDFVRENKFMYLTELD